MFDNAHKWNCILMEGDKINMSTANTNQYAMEYTEQGNVIINYERLCTYINNCCKNKIRENYDSIFFGNTIDNENEEAYEALKWIIKTSLEQLKKNFKVRFVDDSGNDKKVFNSVDEFVSWWQNTNFINNGDFIRTLFNKIYNNFIQ